MPTVNINQIVMFLENSNDDQGPRTLEEAEERFNVKLTDAQRKEIERQMQQNEENRQRTEDQAQEEADRVEEDYAGNE